MNIHQLKQNWQNNWRYGENHRLVDADRPRLADALIQPDYTRIWGIDLSPWDGIVNLGKTKSLGCAFVIIKGVDGAVNSRYFVENYLKSVEVNLPRSSYTWLYRNANVSCVAQAQAFDALMNHYPPSPGIPPAIDFEPTKYAGVQANPNFDDLRRWVTEWLRLGNQKPLLYSAKYYMDQYGQMPSDLKDMFAGLWVANYGVRTPALPLGWNTWKFWQFAANGDALLLAPGSTNKQKLDLNYAALTVTPEPGGTMEQWKVLTSLKVRNGPGISYAQVQSLTIGDIVEGTLDPSTNWIDIAKIIRVGGNTLVPTSGKWWCSGYPSYVEKIVVPDPVSSVVEAVLTEKDAAGNVTAIWRGTLTKQ